MDWAEIGALAAKGAAVAGGAGVMLVGASGWIARRVEARLAESQRARTEEMLTRLRHDLESRTAHDLAKSQQEHERLLDQIRNKNERDMEHLRQSLQSETEAFRAQIHRFGEREFTSYITLWDSLQELRDAAESLWERADENNLRTFVDAFHDARKTAWKASIVIDPRTLTDINELLAVFGEFHVGKGLLIELRTRRSIDRQREMRGASIEEEVQRQIRQNGNLRHRYTDVLDRLRSECRRKLAGSPMERTAERLMLDFH